MKHRSIFLLIFMLASGSWLVAQHAVWWSGSPPPGNTARDHSVSYGNGFAWQVALGTADSEDVGHDAIAVSSGGYLVVGSSFFYDGYTVTHTNLVLYRLNEEGDLMWEKGYTLDNYKVMNEFKVVEKPNGGFLVAGKLSYGGVGVPRRCILLDFDANGDTLSTRKWTFADMATDDFKLIKSPFDESYFISYQRNYSGTYLTDIVKLDYDLDTISIFVLPNYNFVPKPFGFIYRGGRFDNVYYYYAINFQGEVIDSFPDPHGVYNPSTHNPYAIQSLRNGRNVFFRTVTTSPRVFQMATTTDDGEVLNVNPDCFNGDDIWWYNDAGGWNYSPHEFSDRSICMPYNFYFDWNDNYSIGLVKINSQGQLLGDTAMSRSAGSMMLVKVLEGADGRPVVFGTGENGPLGGPLTGDDIFIAKIESWNPVGVPKVNPTDTQPLRIYPNPIGHTVTVELPQGIAGKLTVTTLTGTVVLSHRVGNSHSFSLNTAGWPRGQLLVSLHTPGGVYTTKLIKNL
ncbi:MAG: T9SS type A sorting domain-containing protein [Bacteroidales bacterium]|mgnify:FL=1|nr:T9SS type A sorting domain-containing protein [Bacteroidales bacterium]